MTHKSLRTAGKDVNLFKSMFPDSEIAQKVQLQRDKISYTTVYDLAPYFGKQLLNVSKSCDFVSIGFDESYNKIDKKPQMDINVKFWNDSTREITTRYLTSTFLGKYLIIDKMFLNE